MADNAQEDVGPAVTEGSSPSAAMEAWFAPSSNSYLCLKLVEARNLRAFDATTQSSDPFARMRLMVPGEKAPAFEHRTRTIHRNLNPMFAESLICPLSSLRPDCLFELKMNDADWLRNEAMGRVKCTLSELLQPLGDKTSRLTWMNLTRKHGTLWRKPEGEVLLEVSVLPAETATKALAAQEQFLQQEDVATRYQDCQLEVLLHGLSFQGDHSSSAIAEFAEKLLVEVRVGQSATIHQVNGKVSEDDEGAEGLFDLELGDVVTVPLSAAVQASQVQKSMAQKSGVATDVTDVRIILHHDGNLLSKTQIPLCCLPFAGNAHMAPAGHSPEPSQRSFRHNHSSKSRLSTTSESTVHYVDTGSLAIKEEGEPDDAPALFVRTMEPLARRSPFAAATLEFTAALVKKVGPPSSTTCGSEAKDEFQVLDMLEEQEDQRDAPPFKDIPSPLEFPCLEMEFGFGPCRLYQILLKSASKLHERVAAVQGLTNLNMGPWELVDTDEGQKIRQRKITFRKPINIPVPFAPKAADMTVIQTINQKEISGWVSTYENFTTAPMGDTFKVVIQVLGTRGKASGSSMLRVTMKVEFCKNPGMLRNVIMTQSRKESLEHWMIFRDYLREQYGEEESGQADSSTAQGRELPATASSIPAPVEEARKPTVLQMLSWSSVSSLLPVLRLLLLVLLVLVVYKVAQAVQSLADSIALLAAAQQQQNHE